MNQATDATSGDGSPAPASAAVATGRERIGMVDNPEKKSAVVICERDDGKTVGVEGQMTAAKAAEMMKMVQAVAGQIVGPTSSLISRSTS
ncbi:hypothetical protein DVH05_006773 [Phytophthora capsici]|nr:hypothetical protein DVH05_006773 [Phytophthora capsici]